MTIVVGVELRARETDARVARIAARMAAATSSDVLLVHVSTDPRAPLVLGTPDETVLARARAELDALAEELRRDASVRVTTDLWAGGVADGLTAAADSVVARLLLLTEGSAQPGRVFGTTLERVVRGARVPVLVVREPERLEAWIAGQRPLSVLLGSDLGESAARAMRFVRTWTDYGPVRATVVCVADPASVSRRYGHPSPEHAHTLSPDVEGALRRDVEAQAARAGLPDAEIVIRAGAASPEAHLVVLSEALDVDVVAVGLRRRSWIEEVWYGSVASGVLRGVPTNVVGVPRTLLDEREPLTPVPQVVVVATDLSPVGDSALPLAYGYVAPGGTVHLVHVLDVERLPGSGAGLATLDIERRLRERIPPGAAERGIETRLHVVGGETAGAIVSLAEQVGAGAICIATLGRGTLGAAAFGSVSREVVSLARCPVLVVPAPAE